jgi:hypothetical protein
MFFLGGGGGRAWEFFCFIPCVHVPSQVWHCFRSASQFPCLILVNSVADPDPGSVAFETPGSGMGKKSGSGSWIRIRDEQPGSNFRELKKQFFGLKYFNSLIRIRDGKNLYRVIAHLVPLGTPAALIPVIVIIETVSSVIRPATLAVRLADGKNSDPG